MLSAGKRDTAADGRYLALAVCGRTGFVYSQATISHHPTLFSFLQCTCE